MTSSKLLPLGNVLFKLRDADASGKPLRGVVNICVESLFLDAMVRARIQGPGWEERFLDHLVAQGTLEPLAARRVGGAMQGTGQPLDLVLLELGVLEEHRLADALADYFRLPRIKPEGFPDAFPDGFSVPLGYFQRSGVLPLRVNGATLSLATARPCDENLAAIGYFLGYALDVHVAAASEVSRHLQLLAAQQEAPEDQATPDTTHEADSADVERLRDLASEAPIVRLLNRLIAAAVERGASDIHVEPLEDQTRIRFRLDGALQPVEQLDRSLHLALVSRIKILARLNIAEQRLPQDGRIRLAVRGRDVDFRIATSPTLHGEGVVLRILDRRDVALDFAALGYGTQAIAELTRLIDAPNGIVLVTGPTGSGKTTTLYAALTRLNQPHTKVFSIEDPIEYHLKGISQIQVKPQIGLDFAPILRALLRQDPDVIMVGEIRDGETAKIAVQASLTGHLVLSTLHTNSAAASITRLRNLGIDDFLIASSLRGIVAQRLVRKLCPHCKAPDTTSPSNVPGAAAAPGFVSVGCPKCHHTGYSGRTVVSEILSCSDEIRAAILNGASDRAIEQLAVSQGMMTLQNLGARLVAEGITSAAELRRAVAVT